jgi:hypothetical protein
MHRFSKKKSKNSIFENKKREKKHEKLLEMERKMLHSISSKNEHRFCQKMTILKNIVEKNDEKFLFIFTFFTFIFSLSLFFQKKSSNKL